MAFTSRWCWLSERSMTSSIALGIRQGEERGHTFREATIADLRVVPEGAASRTWGLGPAEHGAARCLGVALKHHPGQLDARPNVELPKHLPQMEIDRVGGQEHACRYLAVGETIGYEHRHCGFRVRQA